ncbi:MAG: hypothetical protein PHG41_06050 [Actinomycetota bacterium]|nr:hypothetical protein [Actinomycetota bacterium]
MGYPNIDYTKEMWCVRCNRFMHRINKNKKFKIYTGGDARIIGAGVVWECPSCGIQVGKPTHGELDYKYDMERGIVR